MVSIERLEEMKSANAPEIRNFLREECGITDSNVITQKKADLITFLDELQKAVVQQDSNEPAEDNVGDVFENTEEENEPTTEEQPLPVPEVVPGYGTEGWEDYVIRQFREHELDNGNPKCVGCRRVIQKIIGPIISSGIVNYTAPSDANNGTGTVVFEASILVENDTHPAFEKTELLYTSDIADVNQLNTDPPFHKHQCATAASRAEGRIYRKILLLSTITAEEASEAVKNSDEWNPDTNIDEGQISVIELMCRPDRCDLNLLEFINCGTNKYANIHAVPRHVAGKMIQELNKVQQGEHPRPSSVGRFDPEWRSNE
jgi:hypothetical protein